MKTLIVLVVGMMVVGCVNLRDGVVGTYERGDGEDTFTLALLNNGGTEAYSNGKKISVGKWEIKDGEIIVEAKNGKVGILRINSDGSLTNVAGLIGGIRMNTPKKYQTTSKKIK